MLFLMQPSATIFRNTTAAELKNVWPFVRLQPNKGQLHKKGQQKSTKKL